MVTEKLTTLRIASSPVVQRRRARVAIACGFYTRSSWAPFSSAVVSRHSPVSQASAILLDGTDGPAHSGNASVVAIRQFLQCSALRAPFGGLFLLCRCQGKGGGPYAFLGP